MNKRRKRHPSLNNEKLLSLLILCIILIVCLAISFFKNDFQSSPTPQNTQVGENAEKYNYVHFLDVGQGDCTLIETHDGKFGLIDCSTGLSGEKIVDYLIDNDVDELEFILFTHPHEDHIGAGDDVLRSFDVKTVYMSERTENTSAYRYLTEELAESKKNNGLSVIRPWDGDTFSLGDIVFTVISDGEGYESINDSSICVRAELGETSLLFTGDAEKVVEYDLLESDFELDSDIYKCAHHGSSTSNSEEFLDEVTPEIAVASCGKDNSHGHPHREIVQTMSERGVPLYRTDLDGDVVIAFDDEIFFITSCDTE